MSLGASNRYYQACVGRWKATVTVELTDGAALKAGGMGALDRLSLWLLSIWPAAFPQVELHTRVFFEGEAQVVHETTIRFLGLPMKRSVERYALDPDGRRLTVSGDMVGTGQVDEDAARAHYAFRWLGVDIEQDTVRDGDLVTVDQRGPGFRGTQSLRRFAAA